MVEDDDARRPLTLSLLKHGDGDVAGECGRPDDLQLSCVDLVIECVRDDLLVAECGCIKIKACSYCVFALILSTCEVGSLAA